MVLPADASGSWSTGSESERPKGRYWTISSSSHLRQHASGLGSHRMIETHPRHVLIAGVTTRAIAVSAAHAGYRVTAVDAFGDLDLRAVADVITLGQATGTRFDPLAAAIAGEPVPAGLVAYTSNLENHPKAVERLARGRRLLGNSPAVLTRVRNPIALSALLRRRGFATPATRATPATKSGVATWLLKPRRSGGGHRIVRWRHARSVPRGSYLQE